MSFSLEVEMYASVLDDLPTLLGFEGHYAYATEIPLSYRVADVGFVPLNGTELDSWETESLARLELTGIWALAYTATSGRVSLDEFTSIFGATSKNLEFSQLIATLQEGGLLDQDQRGLLVPTEWLRSQLGPIIFVELKLSRWKRALQQASFYRAKADISCVAIDGDSVAAVPKSPFVEKGIGLFAAWPDGVEMMAPPRPSHDTSLLHRNFNRLRAIQDLSCRRPGKWRLVSGMTEVV